MTIQPKLTTVAACRVAGFHRDRFNELVHDGAFPCAPQTVPGRARLFDPDDMIALVLFKRLMDDGMTPQAAGVTACEVASGARDNRSEPVIAFVQVYTGTPYAIPAGEVPPMANWQNAHFNGSTIRKVTMFNVEHLRNLIAHGTEEERSIIGPIDE